MFIIDLFNRHVRNMRPPTLLRYALLAFIVPSATLHSQTPPVAIIGIVVDTTNQTVAHAVVTVHANDASRTLLERTLTASNGRVSGISLVPGSYWLIVRRIGFKPDTQLLKVSASNPQPSFTMMVQSVPTALPAVLIVATQCTEFGALARDPVLSQAWDLVETSITSRAALYQNYEYEVMSVDSNYAPERTPQWKVKTMSAHGTPSESQPLQAFNEPLYTITYNRNKPNLKTGTEFSLLSNAFKANHCITLTSEESNAAVAVVRFRNIASAASGFRVEGRIIIDRATSSMSNFSYTVFSKDAYVGQAYCTYGVTDVLGKPFPVLSQIGLMLLNPITGQTISKASSTPTYHSFKQVKRRN